MDQKPNARCTLTSVIENELDILKRHISVLETLQEQQPMGIIKLSELTGYPQHMVRYSLHILEHEGLIEPSSRGAVTTNDVSTIMKDLKEALQTIARASDEILQKIQ